MFIFYFRFQSIPECIYDLPALEIIIGTNNKVNLIEADKLNRLSRLAVLDLSNNNISHLPPELGLMSQLK